MTSTLYKYKGWWNTRELRTRAVPHRALETYVETLGATGAAHGLGMDVYANKRGEGRGGRREWADEGRGAKVKWKKRGKGWEGKERTERKKK